MAEKTTGMNFGSALDALRKGKRTRRAGWNGKGMWISMSSGGLVHASQVWSANVREFAIEQIDQKVEVLPYLVMKTADNKILMGWLASQTDMLSDDWEVA